MIKKRKKPEKRMIHRFRHIRGAWCDVDYKMLHACFDLLCDFVEKEHGLAVLKYQFEYYKNLKWTDAKQQGYENKVAVNNVMNSRKWDFDEVLDLYTWWTTEYLPKYKSGDWDPLFNPEQFEEEQDAFRRLITIRSKLWT